MGTDPHPGYQWAFHKQEKFTMREWANAAGEYDWALLSDEELQAITCLTHSAAIDDGRYRQVTFEATTPDCVQPIVRKWATDDTVTETWTFTVWPIIEPPIEGSLVMLVVDETTGVLPYTEINSGSKFTVRLSEKEDFPNGFPWVEPTDPFDCVDVVSTNFGNFNTGFRQWLI
jgi:hypothetical protein